MVCGDKVILGPIPPFVCGQSDEGRQVFTYALSGSISAGPTVADSTLLIGCEDGAVRARELSLRALNRLAFSKTRAKGWRQTTIRSGKQKQYDILG